MRILIALCIIISSAALYSQSPSKIKVRKGNEVVYFYQVGDACDTVSSKACNKFYFYVNDSLKYRINVKIENGQLRKTSNDSIVTLNYLPGLKYEAAFVKRDSVLNFSKKTAKPKVKSTWELQPLIDGTSSYYPNKIQIKFIDRKTDKVVLENIFYGKN